MNEMFSLRDKVAVVTGAASGIGRAVAERFSAAGAFVVLADMEDATALAADLGGRYVRADVTGEESVADLMRTSASETGTIDICVNNAGIGGDGVPLVETTPADLERTFAVNTLGVFFGMKHVVGYMRPGGAIVNTASIASVIGYPNWSSYTASKWGVVGLTKVAALEYGPRGIRVNCVCPSSVDSPMLQTVKGGKEEAASLQAAAPLTGLIAPAHVAAAMHFLAADDCPLISGHALIVDGGATAGVSPRMIELAIKGAGLA